MSLVADRSTGVLRSSEFCKCFLLNNLQCRLAFNSTVVVRFRTAFQGKGREFRQRAEPAKVRTDVVIDVIINHCASNPQPAWTDMTQKTKDAGSIGRWKYPRR